MAGITISGGQVAAAAGSGVAGGDAIIKSVNCKGTLKIKDGGVDGFGACVKPFFDPFGTFDFSCADPEKGGCEFKVAGKVTIKTVSLLFVDRTTVEWDLGPDCKGEKTFTGVSLGAGYTSVEWEVTSAVPI